MSLHCVCKQLKELGKAVLASIKARYALLTGPIGVTPTLLTGEWDPRLMTIVIRCVQALACCYHSTYSTNAAHYTDTLFYAAYAYADTTTAVEITDHLALSSGIIAAVLSVTSNEQAIGIGESLVQCVRWRQRAAIQLINHRSFIRYWLLLLRRRA
eukprot:20054-Heterococcus_DN1.PRE.2